MLSVPPPPDLRQAISLLIGELDNRILQPVAIAALASRFSIKTRRVYDFVNVLSSLGCCRKSGYDHVIWLGRDHLPDCIRQLRNSREIENPDRSLSDLFPVTGCVGIGNLSVSLMLMFHALRVNHLDLRLVSNFFSRETQRYKSTLCKLYQITLLLCSAGILKRTAQVCDVVLLGPYLDFEVVPSERKGDEDLSEIQTLLNRSPSTDNSAYIHQRRKLIYDLFLESSASKTVILPEYEE
jgi:hypothetical protein